MNQFRKVLIFRLLSVVHKRQSRQLAANVAIAHLHSDALVKPYGVAWDFVHKLFCVIK